MPLEGTERADVTRISNSIARLESASSEGRKRGFTWIKGLVSEVRGPPTLAISQRQYPILLWDIDRSCQTRQGCALDLSLQINGDAIWQILTNHQRKGNTMTTPILGSAQARSDQACVWALEKGAPEWFACDIPKIYWRFAAGYGIRPEVAYAQAALETGFGKFGRAVTREHNNFCGLKVRNPGADDAANSHARFPTPEVGVIAHLEHLGLYAAAPGFPKAVPIDTRHFPYLLASAITVESLSTRWAPSATYHEKIVLFIDQIKSNKGVQ